ncbi:MAG: hypothetical protein L6Q71_11010 [Planctomycetes bacterium]|nr:hypothetical protein [Planctomycetota bacterium]NUQ34984.1 hypothetical protein [Planctomycetaceae bacterium]
MALVVAACSTKHPGKIADDRPKTPVNLAERDGLIDAVLQSKTVEDEELALHRLLNWSHHNYELYEDSVLYDLRFADEDTTTIHFDHVAEYATSHPGSPIYIVVTYNGDKKSFTHKLLDYTNGYILTLE